MKKLYQPYLNQIEKAVRNKPLTTDIGGIRDEVQLSKGMEVERIEPSTGLHDLAELLGIQDVKRPVMGDHPDFKHIRITGRTERHYIVSMFIDVKRSTHLHKKYDLDQIALIIQTIVTAATHTCALFNGHIQRMQYDGVFAYFGGKNKEKDEAVLDSIKAASFFSYFLKYELPSLFELEDIDKVYTRIGIDYGDDDDVQWIVFGTEGCSELTTNSLHTSLAPKMQSYAKNYGIVIGDNVKARLGSISLYCSSVTDSNGNVTRYVYEDRTKNFYYGQYNFEWVKFLKNSFPFIKENEDGNLFIDFTVKNAYSSKRIESLAEEINKVNSGGAFVNVISINTKNTGTKIQPHEFHSNDGKIF